MERVEFNLQGRVALVTGAGRGIGLAIARTFAAHGASVAIQDIDLPLAQSEVEVLRRQGAGAMALGGDLTDPRQVGEMVPQVVSALGGVDILVNNGAIQVARHWTELSLEEIQSQLRADQVAPILLCQSVAALMRPRRWGRIINLGSIQQRAGSAGMLAYSMSKAALANLNSALARDLGPDGITVNLIAPGYFDTYRNRHDLPDDEARRQAGRTIPAGRIGQPRDCAGAALLLASEAGAYITGQTLYIDGGLSSR